MIFKYNELEKANLIEGAIYEGGNQNTPMKDDPLVKLFKVDGAQKGIGNQGGFRKSTKEINGKILKGEFAFVVIVDNGQQLEWPNSYDSEKRIFTYYGDNRKVNNPILETKNKGNEFLLDIFTKAYGTPEMRSKIPPIFIFQSTGNRCDKKFIGLAVPRIQGKNIDQSLKKDIYTSSEGFFENYCAEFEVLPLNIDGISREWLQSLKLGDNSINCHAPQSWVNFILIGHNLGSTFEENQIEAVYEDEIEYKTEQEMKVKVRIVQGKFRQDLIKRDESCVICKLGIPDLLIASHIKPWAKSLPSEQIDLNNGLLLCSNHDALFDKGYITFLDDGKIKISSKINSSLYDKLQISKEIKIKLNLKQKEYMAFHREFIFKI